MRIDLIVIVLLFSTLSATCLHAQQDFSPETYFGVRQGLNISRVGFDPTVSQEINTGYSGGLVFKHISQKSLGIQVEANYMQAGWRVKPDSIGSYQRRLNYIQIPLLTQINIGNQKSRVIINLGPSFAYLISEQETTTIPEELSTKPYYSQSIQNVFDYGFCFDIGFMQKTGIGSFQIIGRMNQSLNSIFRTGSDSPYRSSMNQMFEVSLAYLMDIKRILKNK